MGGGRGLTIIHGRGMLSVVSTIKRKKSRVVTTTSPHLHYKLTEGSVQTVARSVRLQ